MSISPLNVMLRYNVANRLMECEIPCWPTMDQHFYRLTHLQLNDDLTGRYMYCNRRSNVADFQATYEETSTTALSANPSIAVPLLTINGWILMQRKVTGGSVSFNQNWAKYRDGFGSAAGNDNYWLGLDKVYRLMQMGSVRLRVKVVKNETHNTCNRPGRVPNK